ncbi:purple acid phosphatase family protein [Nonomuraea gerenzanensis]|uniref:Ser/Thr protein phosphatase family protein n=1 Tax=Nonomuraea gerenzanensis TaxID=93944 RepID=A0A1M4E566_9ACTN|nr:metallophosphoesterase family protein [Nonomuraea gerenzanensis]UBU16167.1 metallophosphoesterase family protein [Nonomuraea gerenzanensis]SBO93976.1 Ser/Thr protein phosphatase family protein [Nonomuraea gerenzanensis]
MNQPTKPRIPGSRRTKLAAAGSGVLLAGALAFAPAAVGAAAPPVYPAAEVHKPTPIPDRVILIPTTTPATSQRVSWRAEATADTAQAQILEAPRALGQVQPAAGAVATVRALASTPVNTTLGYASTYHTAEFTGLKPDTRYTYRVGDGTNWSAWTDFTTAAEGFEPFSFIYYGDAQNYLDSAVPRVFRQAFADRPQAKAIVNAGDLIDSANSEEQWGQWFKAGGFIDGQVNNISIPGNHEYSGGLSTFWRPQFPYPDNGPGNAELKQTVYTLDYQGVRFIGLDTNHQSNATLMAAQTAWLESLLKDNPNKWTVVTFHHPVYSTTGTRNNPNVRAQWAPLFEKYGVDLVLQGHDHSYGRGNPVSARKSATVHNGVAYVVSVSGGKMYALNGGENWTGNGAEVRSTSQNTQLYQLIDITGDTVTFEARYADGEHHDGFVIRKNDRGERTVNDLRTPENTVGEQVTVDKTAVRRLETLKVSAYGYDPGEKVAIRWRERADDAARHGRDGTLIGYEKADELGRVEETVRVPALVKKGGVYEVYLDSQNQQITSPAVTVTK